MSDEESFVILGSSPMSSLEADGDNGEHKSSLTSTSLETDTPGSSFSSLQRSQLKELQNAQEMSTQTPESIGENNITVTQDRQVEEQMPKENSIKEPKSTSLESIQNGKNTEKLNGSNIQIEPELAEPMVVTPVKTAETSKTETGIADSKLWSRSPQVEENINDVLSCLSLEDCAVPSPLESRKQHTNDLNKSQQTVLSSSNLDNLEKKLGTNNSPLPGTSLASSYIMGEINADVLKSSVYSQFPSVSMNASAEEIVKLQNMVTENIQFKVVLEKVNNTMRSFHNQALEWNKQMTIMETKYKTELAKCHKEIEMLRQTNQVLKPQIEAVEIARQKDREETIQELSEKSSLIDNMRAQIVKLEKQQMASFEFVDKKKTTDDFDKYYIKRGEHDLQIKELERKLSELLASNLDFKDIEKQYIDELNCLKVTLTSAEELIKTHNATIAQLFTKDRESQQKIKELEITVAKQNERISLLEQQNEVHRKDFEMEKESRQVAIKEKQEILQDLRNLQKRNHELIEQHQKLADSYEKRFNSQQNSDVNKSFVSAAAAAQTYFNNPQRPIRNLPSSPSANQQQTGASTDFQQQCPLCFKKFKSLSILQSHVNDCIDKN